MKYFKEYCYENPDVVIELVWEDGYSLKQNLGGKFIYQGKRKHEGKRPIILRVLNKPELAKEADFLEVFGHMLHPIKKQPIEFIND